jgi:hypothetical protein
MTGAYHHSWLVGSDLAFVIFLLGLALKTNSVDLCLPGSWDYKCKPLCSASKSIHFKTPTIYKEFQIAVMDVMRLVEDFKQGSAPLGLAIYGGALTTGISEGMER